MTREETKQILAVIDVAFQNFKPENLTLTTDVWHMMLEDVPYNYAANALKAYIRSDTSGFPPTIGQLIEHINILSKPQELNVTEAWALVKQAIRNGIYGAEKEFNELPPLVQKAVGDYKNIYDWAITDSSTVNTVIFSHFVKSYNDVLNYEQQRIKLSEKMKNHLDNLNQEPHLGIEQVGGVNGRS